MMRIGKGLQHALLALCLGLVIAGIVGKKNLEIVRAEQVLLAIDPVDPLSLLQGYYVVLNYRIGAVELGGNDAGRPFQGGGPVWVPIAPGADGVWSVAGAPQTSKPAQGTAIQGQVRYVDLCSGDAAWEDLETCAMLMVDYGINDYFIQEGDGLIIEQASRDDPDSVRVEVAIDRETGLATLTGVLVGDRRY